MRLDSAYEGLVVIVGEPAKAGAFYVPVFSESISKIANQAYGVGTLPFSLRINKSAWNRANCVYRVKSGKCYSKRVSSSLSLSQNNFGDGAWLALCQADTQDFARDLGFKYPMIWVPGPGGEEPEDLAKDPGVPKTDPVKVVKTPGGLHSGAPEAKEPALIVGPGDPMYGIPEDEGDDGYGNLEPTKGGLPGWVIGVGIGTAVLGIAAVAYSKSKKGR